MFVVPCSLFVVVFCLSIVISQKSWCSHLFWPAQLVVLASPANPLGSVTSLDELQRIAQVVEKKARDRSSMACRNDEELGNAMLSWYPDVLGNHIWDFLGEMMKIKWWWLTRAVMDSSHQDLLAISDETYTRLYYGEGSVAPSILSVKGSLAATKGYSG